MGSPPVRATNPLVQDTQFCAWKLQSVDQSLGVPIPSKGYNVRCGVREGFLHSWSYMCQFHDRLEHSCWCKVVAVTLLFSTRRSVHMSSVLSLFVVGNRQCCKYPFVQLCGLLVSVNKCWNLFFSLLKQLEWNCLPFGSMLNSVVVLLDVGTLFPSACCMVSTELHQQEECKAIVLICAILTRKCTLVYMNLTGNSWTKQI